MTGVSEALVKRMIALVRACAERQPFSNEGSWNGEARAIVAELPAPVDPDLTLVRDGLARILPYSRNDILAGVWDDKPSITFPLAMLKHGRELAERGL